MSLYLWCDKAKWVWSQKIWFLVFLHFLLGYCLGFNLVKTPQRLGIWFQRYKQLKDWTNSKQGRNRKIFPRGQNHFSWFFFPVWNAFFPVENFHFGTPKTNFCHFEKWKAKKKKKKKKDPLLILLLLELFSSFHFQFSFFSSPFSVFSLPLFPSRSAEISQSEVSGGHSAPHLLCNWQQETK